MPTVMRKAYATDLTDEQWLLIESLIPPAKPIGRPRTVCMREVLNTIFFFSEPAVNGDCFRTISSRRARSTMISNSGSGTERFKQLWMLFIPRYEPKP